MGFLLSDDEVYTTRQAISVCDSRRCPDPPEL
jgi:hypothetical protein